MQYQVHRPVRQLPIDMFPTLPRERTKGIVLAYTRTYPNPHIDARYLDSVDRRLGYFGLTHHYIITTTGRIELGRNPRLRTSRTKRRHLQTDAIHIGIVGGLDGNAEHAHTITPEQAAASEWLMQTLADAYGVPLEVTDHIENWSVAGERTDGDYKQAVIDGVYAEMTQEELDASPDRITP